MGLLSGPVIEAEIIAASGFQALVSKYFLDMSDRTTIKKHLRGRRVPKEMRSYRLVNTGKLSIAIKETPDIRTLQPRFAVLRNKQCWMIVGAARQISF